MCPPPPSVGLKPIPFEYDRVLAWTLGNRLGGLDRDVVQQRVREIHQSDLRRGRPIYAHAVSHWSDLASVVDAMGAGQQPIGTSFFTPIRALDGISQCAYFHAPKASVRS